MDTVHPQKSIRKESTQKHNLLKYILVTLLVALFISCYTFILQRNYSNDTLNAEIERDVTCSDAIHKVVSSKLSRDDFTTINSAADKQTERYQELQQSLNEIRSLNSTRYLYTAKRDSNGRLVYLVDGLDPDAEDFRNPGDYI